METETLLDIAIQVADALDAVSAGQPEDVDRCRKLGITAYLTKPIKQSELFDVIVSAVSQPTAEPPQGSEVAQKAFASAQKPPRLSGRGQSGQSIGSENDF